MKFFSASMIGAIIMLFFACNNEQPDKSHISKKDALTEVATDVEVLYSDSAVIRIKIQGKKLLSHIERDNLYDEFPEGVRLDFFDSQQQPSSVLTGKYAVRYPAKNQVIIRDSCVWQSISSQEKLEAFELIWDENLQKVYSDKLVIITTPTEKIWGYGFETNQDFTRWKISKPQGRLAVDKIQ